MSNWDGVDRRKSDRYYGEILSKLHDIEIKLELNVQKTDSNHKITREFQAEVIKSNEKVNQAIWGNGKPGIVSKIETVESLEKDLYDHAKNDFWFRGVMITVLLAILGWTIFK